jgi:hypothetical protein
VSALELTLAGAALLIGLTGAWSPCGFSMVETIGLSGDGARRRTTIAACATFAPGAVLGGVATFGLLAALGEIVHGFGGRIAYLAAAGIAVAAAIAEARGARIAPQIRRQLPEQWRWVMPLPLAAALYGILLGLGFTTFVLSFGVWALAGISFALGHPGAGLVIGAAFGIGRAIPVVLVAPAVDRPLGIRCIELMAERPALYRGFRVGDAVTLGLVAVALTATGTASAARTAAVRAADPSSAGKAFAFQRPDRSGILRQHGQKIELPGRDPAVGGPYVAVVSGGDSIKILSRATLEEVGSASAPDAEALAISQGWLAYLVVDQGHYVLNARRIGDPQNPGAPKRIAAVSSPAQIGHPGLDGTRLFYAVAHARNNKIKRRSLGSGKGGTVVASRSASLSNPSVYGRHLLYVRIARARQSPQATHPERLVQSLILKRLGHGGGGRKIYSRGGDGFLWSTALSGKRAFVTLTRGGEEKIISVHH